MAKKSQKAELAGVSQVQVVVRLKGVSPLVQHCWSEKARTMMRDKQQTGKKTKTRELKDPKAEGEAAMYRTEDGKPGIPAVAIKAAVIDAAHNDLGMPKTLVRKSLFIHPFGRDVVLPLEHADKKKRGAVEYAIEEDMVRVGQGSADLRYRPYFYDWGVTTTWIIDADGLQVSDLLTLLDRAGFGIGVCEWRPEKGGQFGRFKIDETVKPVETVL